MSDSQPATLTPASVALFTALAEDAPNWSGTPMVDVSPQERGNLTALKKAGLLTTFTDAGCVFAEFTPAGAAYAATLGILWL